MDNRGDDELMRTIASGDEDGLRVLMERWERPVFGFLVRMLQSEEDARELTSETFYRVYRNAPSYRAEGKFKSWLFRISGNLARSALRRKRILRWVGIDEAPEPRASPSTQPDDVLEARARAEALEVAVQSLPARQRQAILLRLETGMSYREIADTMHTSVSAVETLLHRATTRLKQRMGGLT